MQSANRRLRTETALPENADPSVERAARTPIGAIEDAPVREPTFEIVAPAKNSGPSLFDDSSELTGWPNTIDADA